MALTSNVAGTSVDLSKSESSGETIENYNQVKNALIKNDPSLGWITAVPFKIPGGATMPVLGFILTFGLMRRIRKLVSNNH